MSKTTTETGESRRKIEFVNNGNNTCEIRISGPFSASAEAVLDGGAMRELQNSLASGLTVPDATTEPCRCAESGPGLSNPCRCVPCGCGPA